MKWKRMGTWNSDIGFNYDDLFPCIVGVDLFPCCVDIHGIVSFHVETIVVFRDKKVDGHIGIDWDVSKLGIKPER